MTSVNTDPLREPTTPSEDTVRRPETAPQTQDKSDGSQPDPVPSAYAMTRPENTENWMPQLGGIPVSRTETSRLPEKSGTPPVAKTEPPTASPDETPQETATKTPNDKPAVSETSDSDRLQTWLNELKGDTPQERPMVPTGFSPKTVNTRGSLEDWASQLRQESLNSWLDQLKKPFNNAMGWGITGRSMYRLANRNNHGYDANVLGMFASNSGSTFGLMDMPTGGPGDRTLFGRAWERSLRSSSSFLDSLNNLPRVTANTNGGSIGPVGWQARRVGGEDGDRLKDSVFNVSTRNKEDGKTFFVSFTGGPERAFRNSGDAISNIFRNKFDATVIQRAHGGPREMNDVFGKISRYADRHPDTPVRVVFYHPTHGNNDSGSGGGLHDHRGGGGYPGLNREGAGRSWTAYMDENHVGTAIRRHFNGKSNIGFFGVFDSCYSGGFIEWDRGMRRRT